MVCSTSSKRNLLQMKLAWFSVELNDKERRTTETKKAHEQAFHAT